MLDEPTVGLDPVLRADLWSAFHALAADGADAPRLEPRDGRGGRVRRAAADARRARSSRRRRPQALRARDRREDLGEAFLARDRGGRRRERARRRSRRPCGCWAAPPRPADARAAAGRAARAAGAARYLFDGQPAAFQKIGAPLLRPLPVHRDVPGHVDRDAARAHDRHARAADDAAAGQGSTCSPATGSPSALLAAVQAVVVCVVGFVVLGLDAAGTARGWSACSRSPTRCSAWRSACS